MNIIITPETISQRHSVLSKTNSSDDTPDQPGCENITDPQDITFFVVQTLCSSTFPQISPTATPKVISASALPSFVRQLALNASVLSLVWSNREGGENVSSWRNRLKEILKLRQRYANTGTSANVSYPGMGNPSDRGGDLTSTVIVCVFLFLISHFSFLIHETCLEKYDRAKHLFYYILLNAYLRVDMLIPISFTGWTGKLAMAGMAEREQFLYSADFTRWT